MAEDADLWLDVLDQFMRSREWQSNLDTFVSAHCILFVDDSAFDHTHWGVYQDFRNMVENILSSVLTSVGGDVDKFAKAVDDVLSRGNPREAERARELVDRLLTFDDFMAFATMMRDRNFQLQGDSAQVLASVNQSMKDAAAAPKPTAVPVAEPQLAPAVRLDPSGFPIATPVAEPVASAPPAPAFSEEWLSQLALAANILDLYHTGQLPENLKQLLPWAEAVVQFHSYLEALEAGQDIDVHAMLQAQSLVANERLKLDVLAAKQLANDNAEMRQAIQAMAADTGHDDDAQDGNYVEGDEPDDVAGATQDAEAAAKEHSDLVSGKGPLADPDAMLAWLWDLSERYQAAGARAGDRIVRWATKRGISGRTLEELYLTLKTYVQQQVDLTAHASEIHEFVFSRISEEHEALIPAMLQWLHFEFMYYMAQKRIRAFGLDGESADAVDAADEFEAMPASVVPADRKSEEAMLERREAALQNLDTAVQRLEELSAQQLAKRLDDDVVIPATSALPIVTPHRAEALVDVMQQHAQRTHAAAPAAIVTGTLMFERDVQTAPASGTTVSSPGADEAEVAFATASVASTASTPLVAAPANAARSTALLGELPQLPLQVQPARHIADELNDDARRISLERELARVSAEYEAEQRQLRLAMTIEQERQKRRRALKNMQRVKKRQAARDAATASVAAEVATGSASVAAEVATASADVEAVAAGGGAAEVASVSAASTPTNTSHHRPALPLELPTVPAGGREAGAARLVEVQPSKQPEEVAPAGGRVTVTTVPDMRDTGGSAATSLRDLPPVSGRQAIPVVAVSEVTGPAARTLDAPWPSPAPAVRPRRIQPLAPAGSSPQQHPVLFGLTADAEPMPVSARSAVMEAAPAVSARRAPAPAPAPVPAQAAELPVVPIRDIEPVALPRPPGAADGVQNINTVHVAPGAVVNDASPVPSPAVPAVVGVHRLQSERTLTGHLPMDPLARALAAQVAQTGVRRSDFAPEPAPAPAPVPAPAPAPVPSPAPAPKVTVPRPVPSIGFASPVPRVTDMEDASGVMSATVVNKSTMRYLQAAVRRASLTQPSGWAQRVGGAAPMVTPVPRAHDDDTLELGDISDDENL